MSTIRTSITVARGDGIGPEIMDACLHVLEEAGAQLRIEAVSIGEKIYRRGDSSGIDIPAWEAIRRTGVLYKAPVTVPAGVGFKSLPATLRKGLGLHANVRPNVSYYPFTLTLHPEMDVVVIRENEEDLYSGIEYQISPNTVESLKIVNRQAAERICRYAFEYARIHGRRKITCVTRSGVLRMSDGMFQKVFDETGAAMFPELEREHMQVDTAAAGLARAPQSFDVIVTSNLYGDILSDIAAQVAGSIGMGGSACIGTRAAMFEAIHGSAPKYAGKGVANPSGLLLSGVMMLLHLGQCKAAARVHNALLKTIEDGVHTFDVCLDGASVRKVGTKDFALAVIERLGERPATLRAVEYPEEFSLKLVDPPPRQSRELRLVGVDVFLLHSNALTGSTIGSGADLAGAAASANGGGLTLQWVDCRGVKVWPEANVAAGSETADAVAAGNDSYRCRYLSHEFTPVSPHQVTALLDRMAYAGLRVAKTEYLHLFDSHSGFSLSQGL